MTQPQTSYLRARDYVKITIFGFALTALYQSLHSIILPLRLLDFVDESQKNTYLGLLTLSGLFLAAILQPVFATMSDRTISRWGRRRPYVFIGGVAAALLIPGIGIIGTYFGLFAVYCLLQISTNIAQGPYQGLIPDLVPENKHGTAAGVKGLIEIVGGIILVYLSSLWMDRYYDGEGAVWLWLVLGILAVLLLGTALINTLMVREPQLVSARRSLPFWTTIYRTFKTDIWQNRSFIWFLLSRMLIHMAFMTIQQFALYYLQDVIGVEDPGKATATFSIIAVVGMVIVVWPAGYLSDRFGRIIPNMLSGLLGAVGIGIIAFSQEYGTILWAAAIIGVGLGIFNSTNWALATDFVPQEEGARYLAIANMATAGGAVIARAIGPVIDFFNGKSPNQGYDVMLFACLTYFVIGALLLLRVRRKRYETIDRY